MRCWQRGAANTPRRCSRADLVWLAVMLSVNIVACSSREKPIDPGNSQPADDVKVGDEPSGEDTADDIARQDLGASSSGPDGVADDSHSGAVTDASGPGDAQADSAADAGVIATVEDVDGGDGLGPDVGDEDDVPVPISLTQVCDDGVPPGPKVGSACSAQGERRCLHLKEQVQSIGLPVSLHTSFCARPYFVECGKNAQGKLIWQAAQTCAGPGVSPKSTNPSYSCNAGPSQLYHKVCRPGVSGTAHFCCPRIAESNQVSPKDYGRAHCYPGWTSYGQALSYNQLSADQRARLNVATRASLEACSGPVHDCVYWLGFTALPKERLWCIDPKKKPVKDQYGQFKPPEAEWLQPHCIQVSDTKVRFAKTCKESGYWDAPGPKP